MFCCEGLRVPGSESLPVLAPPGGLPALHHPRVDAYQAQPRQQLPRSPDLYLSADHRGLPALRPGQ